MIEEQLADRMRSALAEEPPLGFDPDELVDRARRRRRTNLASVGAAGLVLAVAVTATVVMSRGGGGPVNDVGAQVSTTPAPPDAACPRVPPGNVPPPHFPGSDKIVARLDEAAPRVIAAHLPGVSVQPSETGMIAYDCPPNVGTIYPVTGVNQSVMVYVTHARGVLDLDNDRYAEDPMFQLLSEEQVADGAWIRTYGSDTVEAGTGSALAAVRFGLDGVVTEAYLGGTGPLVAGQAELTALASDPELRF